MSLGCPPPCAWKIVDGVVRMKASFSFSSEEEGGGLKRDWCSWESEVRGAMLVMGAVWVCFEPSFWYKGSVRAVRGVGVVILMEVLVGLRLWAVGCGLWCFARAAAMAK